jgi:hypothetical protein
MLGGVTGICIYLVGGKLTEIMMMYEVERLNLYNNMYSKNIKSQNYRSASCLKCCTHGIEKSILSRQSASQNRGYRLAKRESSSP